MNHDETLPPDTEAGEPSAEPQELSELSEYPAGFKPRQFSDQRLYQLRLPSFTGPLDLLLFLLRKHKIELGDIQVAEITRHYLDYLELMKELDVELATEFLVMASELIELKARMLLPREKSDEEQPEEESDPREELARRLREYERFRQAAQQLEERPIHGRETFSSGLAQLGANDDPAGDELVFAGLEPFKLIATLAELLKKTDGAPVKVLEVQRINLRKYMENVLRRLSDGLTRAFVDLFVLSTTRLSVIITFLAILELAKLRQLKLHQTERDEEIFVVPVFEDLDKALAIIYQVEATSAGQSPDEAAVDAAQDDDASPDGPLENGSVE